MHSAAYKSPPPAVSGAAKAPPSPGSARQAAGGSVSPSARARQNTVVKQPPGSRYPAHNYPPSGLQQDPPPWPAHPSAAGQGGSPTRGPQKAPPASPASKRASASQRPGSPGRQGAPSQPPPPAPPMAGGSASGYGSGRSPGRAAQRPPPSPGSAPPRSPIRGARKEPPASPSSDAQRQAMSGARPSSPASGAQWQSMSGARPPSPASGAQRQSASGARPPSPVSGPRKEPPQSPSSQRGYGTSPSAARQTSGHRVAFASQPQPMSTSPRLGSGRGGAASGNADWYASDPISPGSSARGSPQRGQFRSSAGAGSPYASRRGDRGGPGELEEGTVICGGLTVGERVKCARDIVVRGQVMIAKGQTGVVRGPASSDPQHRVATTFDSEPPQAIYNVRTDSLEPIRPSGSTVERYHSPVRRCTPAQQAEQRAVSPGRASPRPESATPGASARPAAQPVSAVPSPTAPPPSPASGAPSPATAAQQAPPPSLAAVLASTPRFAVASVNAPGLASPMSPYAAASAAWGAGDNYAVHPLTPQLATPNTAGTAGAVAGSAPGRFSMQGSPVTSPAAPQSSPLASPVMPRQTVAVVNYGGSCGGVSPPQLASSVPPAPPAQRSDQSPARQVSAETSAAMEQLRRQQPEKYRRFQDISADFLGHRIDAARYHAVMREVFGDDAVESFVPHLRVLSPRVG
eukprot:TRINITY_DN2526_c0_g1_i4.p1 TRINITY_DN2526_c0_g1~~TRINITY_DN2526_c0_g1_i4.p1  ORF type:complete len:725 (+),score=78.32 TRINITY_DN2526_c0_g1_i4:109-2175(+)